MANRRKTKTRKAKAKRSKVRSKPRKKTGARVPSRKKKKTAATKRRVKKVVREHPSIPWLVTVTEVEEVGVKEPDSDDESKWN